METKFNFNSAICTSVEQSRRLLELGLKKETADCNLNNYSLKGKSYQDDWQVGTAPYNDCLESWRVFAKDSCWELIPAWSLHRLVFLTNTDNIKIACNEKNCWGGNILKIAQRKAFEKDNLYDNIIDCIEWLIKEGYFNKEYLENGN